MRSTSHDNPPSFDDAITSVGETKPMTGSVVEAEDASIACGADSDSSSAVEIDHLLLGDRSTHAMRRPSGDNATEVTRGSALDFITRGGSDYGLWLERNIKNATLILTKTGDEAKERFASEKIDAFAGLRDGLAKDVQKNPGMRILSGQFASVQQAVGTLKQNTAAIAYLREVVEDAKASGLIADFIKKHKANGLSVAPAG